LDLVSFLNSHNWPGKIVKTELNGGGNYVQLNFPDTDSSHFLKIKNPNELAPNSTIVTSTCLGCTDFGSVKMENGKSVNLGDPDSVIDSKLIELKFNNQMSPYELANLIEIPKVIQNVLSTGNNIDKIVINMPGTSYYFYLIEAFENAYITKEQIIKYFDYVDMRDKKIGEALKRRISRITNGQTMVEIKSNLDQSIRDLIREYILSGMKDSNFPSVLAGSVNSKVYQAIISGKNNLGYKDLAHADYSSVYLDEINENRGQVLAIENFGEERTLSVCKKLASELNLDHNKLSGLFIQPKLVPDYSTNNSIDSRLKNSNLYFLEQPDKLSISNIKQILKFYRGQSI
jgi:hypothetical protein